MGVNQHYLFEARQMQALSLAVHIPLVCFGIAFPVLVLFAEYRYLRTGDDLYRVLARRWSRVMLALFAVGVVTGTILSFELGLLWPEWMADFGNVFGLGFTLEGFSFFLEAIFIGIYAYGWDRLRPGVHFLTGVPVAVAGVAGSMFVISVNGWMNHPAGFRLAGGRAVDVHPLAGPVRQPDVLERVRAHVLRRVHRVRVPTGRRVRVDAAARPPRPVRAHRAGHHGDGRRGGRAAAGHRR
jgi:cytochrome d ubiquinol oxidase subunit I